VFEKFTPSTPLIKLLYYLPCFGKAYKFQGKRVKFVKAPEPTQIIWENVGVDFKDKIKVKMISLFATIILLGGGFGLIVFLYWAQVINISNILPNCHRSKYFINMEMHPFLPRSSQELLLC
jgi:hypothetical protein